MASKKARVNPNGSEAVKLTTNVYDIKATKATKVYRYTMTVTQYVPARNGDENKGIELTRGVRGE